MGHKKEKEISFEKSKTMKHPLIKLVLVIFFELELIQFKVQQKP